MTSAELQEMVAETKYKVRLLAPVFIGSATRDPGDVVELLAIQAISLVEQGKAEAIGFEMPTEEKASGGLFDFIKNFRPQT